MKILPIPLVYIEQTRFNKYVYMNFLLDVDIFIRFIEELKLLLSFVFMGWNIGNHPVSSVKFAS